MTAQTTKKYHKTNLSSLSKQSFTQKTPIKRVNIYLSGCGIFLVPKFRGIVVVVLQRKQEHDFCLIKGNRICNKDPLINSRIPIIDFWKDKTGKLSTRPRKGLVGSVAVINFPMKIVAQYL